MSKRNKRKMKKKQVQVPFPLLLTNVLIMVAVLGLSYMGLCSRCEDLGKAIKKNEGELHSAQKRLMNEQERWSYQTTPSKLEQSMRRHGLNMSMPSEDQIVRVVYYKRETKPTVASLRSTGNPQVFN